MGRLLKKAAKGLVSAAYGMAFGIGSPVPGVSAGSLAIVLGVYESFFKAVSFRYVRQNLFAAACFLAGWAAGLALVSSAVIFLLDNFFVAVSFAFKGLVVGCLPLIWAKARRGRTGPADIAVFLAMLVAMLFVAAAGGHAEGGGLDELGGVTPGLLARVFVASFFSSMAMLVPGVGGSLAMLALGIYALYLEAVATLNAPLLLTFGAGMALGVLAGTALTKQLLARFPQGLYCGILGLVVGSLFVMYPGFSPGAEGAVSVLLFFLAASVSFWFSMKGPAQASGENGFRVLGVRFDALSEQAAADRLAGWLAGDGSHVVVTPNPEGVMLAKKNADFAGALERADLSLVDGTGVYLAARLGGIKLPGRARGTDVTFRLLDGLRAGGRAVTAYFLGGRPGVAAAAAEKMQLRYPNLTAVGHRHGFFGPDEEEGIAAEISGLRPDILLVCLGMPKAEIFAGRHGLGAKVALCVGGTIDIMAGQMRRAPVFMQKIGMEWLYRLAREPRRFFRMLALPAFALAVFSDRLGGRE